MPTIETTLVAFGPEGFPMGTASMPAATVDYLLQNGLSQSLTDARTTAQARCIEAFAKATKATKAEVDAWKATDEGKAEIAKAGEDAMQKRMEALLAGTMVYGARGPNGPRKSPLEAFLWETAQVELKSRMRAKGLAWPKERERTDALTEAYIAKHRKDLEKRFAAQSKGADDLDDLLAEAGI